MNIPNLKELQWFSPPNMGGENISSIMLRYIEFFGWKIGDNPCLIYAGSESQLERGIEAKRKFPDIPFILNFWGWMPERFTDMNWNIHYSSKLDLMSKYVDEITVPNNQVAEQLSTLGVTGKITILPPGVDTIGLLLSKIQSKKFIKPRPFVLSIGRLVPHKNFQSVILAMKDINYRYIIIGKGEFKDELLRLAKENNVDLSIMEDATDATKGEMIALAKGLIVPSSYEGFGLPIIEGATMGTPVIASNLPVFNELFQDNLEYFYGIDELKSKIWNVIEDEQYRKEIINKEAVLALKFSAFAQSALLNNFFMDEVSKFLKEKLKVECTKGTNSLADAYNVDALIDRKYFDYRLDPNNPLFFFRAEPLLANLAGETVLDVGSSTGIFALYMARKGFKVTSIDIAEEYLKITEALIHANSVQDNVTLKQCDASKLQGIFEDKSFDNIWAGEIIEHFKDSSELLRELMRVLKIGGRFLLTAPYQNACYDAFHLNIFNTEEDIKNIFKEFPAFEIKEIKRIGSPGGGHKNWFAWGIKNG